MRQSGQNALVFAFGQRGCIGFDTTALRPTPQHLPAALCRSPRGFGGPLRKAPSVSPTGTLWPGNGGCVRICRHAGAASGTPDLR